MVYSYVYIRMYTYIYGCYLFTEYIGPLQRSTQVGSAQQCVPQSTNNNLNENIGMYLYFIRI